MFELKPCPSDYVETARWRFVNTLILRASPDEVFDVISSSEREKEWFPDFVGATWRTPEPQGEGSVRLYQLSYMRILEHFTVWERGRRLAFWVSQCSLPLVRRFCEEYRISPDAEGGCKLEWHVCYDPHPAMCLFHSILRPFFARDFRKAARALDTLLGEKPPAIESHVEQLDGGQCLS